MVSLGAVPSDVCSLAQCPFLDERAMSRRRAESCSSRPSYFDYFCVCAGGFVVFSCLLAPIAPSISLFDSKRLVPPAVNGVLFSAAIMADAYVRVSVERRGCMEGRHARGYQNCRLFSFHCFLRTFRSFPCIARSRAIDDSIQIYHYSVSNFTHTRTCIPHKIAHQNHANLILKQGGSTLTFTFT
jgi:hypothetical protein